MVSTVDPQPFVTLQTFLSSSRPAISAVLLISLPRAPGGVETFI